MKLRIDATSLQNTLKTTTHAIPKRPVHPIMSYILIQVEPGSKSVAIHATDLKSYVKYVVDAEIISPGSVCVPFTIFKKMVDKISGCITLSSNDDNLITISGCQNNSTLQGVSSDDFIDPPSLTKITGSMILDSNDLILSIKKLSPHIGSSSQDYLQGIHLGNRRFIASDGHKIAIKSIIATGDNPRAVIDPSFIKLIPQGLIKNSRLIDLQFFDQGDKSLIKLNLPCNGGFIIQREIESNKNLSDFTPPTGLGTLININRKDLINTLDLARVCSAPETTGDPIGFLSIVKASDGHLLTIETKMSADNVHCQIDGEIEFSPVPVLVNLSYMISLLKVIDTDNVSIGLPHGLHLITLEQDDLLLGCMPVDPIKNGKVGAYGAGFHPALDLPYEYDDGCLTVLTDKYGYLTAIKVPAIKVPAIEVPAIEVPAIQLAPGSSHFTPQEKQENETYERSRDLEFIQRQPTDVLGCPSIDNLKKHYKTLKQFNAEYTKIGRKINTWLAASTTISNLCIKYQNIVDQLCQDRSNKPQPVTVEELKSTEPQPVTVEELKSMYVSFKAAKLALQIKAASWAALAEKFNAKSNKPEPKSSASIERVVSQLKAKYGKLAIAKAALQLKAASWAALAEKFNASAA